MERNNNIAPTNYAAMLGADGFKAAKGEYLTRWAAYLLDGIGDHFGECHPSENCTPAALVRHFVETYKEEFAPTYRAGCTLPMWQRYGEYLQGLPGVCSVAFTYYDIEELGKQWGEKPDHLHRFSANWFRDCGKVLQVLQNFYKIS